MISSSADHRSVMEQVFRDLLLAEENLSLLGAPSDLMAMLYDLVERCKSFSDGDADFKTFDPPTGRFPSA